MMGSFLLSHRSDLVKGMLFSQHPNIEHLAEVLFTVFVSIETTGESVEFEQKLNYRQPMYRVIDYIWKIDLHRKAIKVCPGCLTIFFLK